MGKRSNRWSVPEFTSERDERVRILVNSHVIKVSRMVVIVSRKCCKVKPRKGVRHASKNVKMSNNYEHKGKG